MKRNLLHYTFPEGLNSIYINGKRYTKKEFQDAQRDILNSINFLEKDGIILVHDCMPDSLGKQAVPRYKMQWNDDV